MRPKRVHSFEFSNILKTFLQILLFLSVVDVFVFFKYVQQCINIWPVFVLLFASYLYSICYCHLPPTLGNVWSEISFFATKSGFLRLPSDRISSQLLFCISCPSVMRFAVSGINKQSGGSGNITECNSQGPKLIWARFGGSEGTELYLHCIALYMGDMVGRHRHKGRHVVPAHV